MTDMRAWLPVILVLLGVFTAGCIAYVAWELTAEDSKRPESDTSPDSDAAPPEQ